MDGIAIVLVLTSACLHAGWNLLLHRSDDQVATIAFSYVLGGLVLLPFAVADPPVTVLGWLVLAVLFHAGYQYLLSGAFARGGLSITYPMARGISPLLVGLGGWLLLDQRPSASTVAGIVLISVGLLSMAHLGRRLTQFDAVAYAALTGVCIAGYSLVDARAVTDTGPLGYFAVSATLAGLLVMLTDRVDAGRIAAVWRMGAVIATAQTAAYVLILYAFQRAQAAQVASLRQLSVVVSVLIAGEVARRQAFVAATLIAIGAIVLAS